MKPNIRTALNGYAIQLTEDAIANLSSSPDIAAIVPEREYEVNLRQYVQSNITMRVFF